MAITTAEQVDLLWKKLVYGVTETAVANGTSGKTGSNETIASPLSVYSSNIWAQTDSVSIPTTPPSANTATIAPYTVTANTVIQATADPTAAPNQTWLATASYGTTASRLANWIPATFGPLYVIQAWIGNPVSGPAARILPDTAGEEFVFDYDAGVLYFLNSVPAAKTATVGSGSVSVAAQGIYLVGYRYIGVMGVAGAGTTSKISVVSNIAARATLSGVNTGDMVHVLDAGTAGDPAVVPGQYANYLWDGSTWSLVSTQASAKADAASDATTVTYQSNAATQLGYISGNNRIAAVTVTVNTAFNGNCGISAGDASNHSNIIGNSMIDLTIANAIFVATPAYVYPANAQTDLFVYLTTDGTATQGSAQVIVTFA